MKKTFKKIMGLAIALCMTISTLPAFAEETGGTQSTETTVYDAFAWNNMADMFNSEKSTADNAKFGVEYTKYGSTNLQNFPILSYTTAGDVYCFSNIKFDKVPTKMLVMLDGHKDGVQSNVMSVSIDSCGEGSTTVANINPKEIVNSVSRNTYNYSQEYTAGAHGYVDIIENSFDGIDLNATHDVYFSLTGTGFNFMGFQFFSDDTLTDAYEFIPVSEIDNSFTGASYVSTDGAIRTNPVMTSTNTPIESGSSYYSPTQKADYVVCSQTKYAAYTMTGVDFGETSPKYMEVRLGGPDSYSWKIFADLNGGLGMKYYYEDFGITPVATITKANTLGTTTFFHGNNYTWGRTILVKLSEDLDLSGVHSITAFSAGSGFNYFGIKFYEELPYHNAFEWHDLSDTLDYSKSYITQYNKGTTFMQNANGKNYITAKSGWGDYYVLKNYDFGDDATKSPNKILVSTGGATPKMNILIDAPETKDGGTVIATVDPGTINAYTQHGDGQHFYLDLSKTDITGVHDVCIYLTSASTSFEGIQFFKDNYVGADTELLSSDADFSDSKMWAFTGVKMAEVPEYVEMVFDGTNFTEGQANIELRTDTSLVSGYAEHNNYTLDNRILEPHHFDETKTLKLLLPTSTISTKDNLVGENTIFVTTDNANVSLKSLKFISKVIDAFEIIANTEGEYDGFVDFNEDFGFAYYNDANGSSIKFNSVDFAEAPETFTVKMASNTPVEFRLDAVDGDLIAAFNTESEDVTVIETVTADIPLEVAQKMAGMHTIYVVVPATESEKEVAIADMQFGLKDVFYNEISKQLTVRLSQALTGNMVAASYGDSLVDACICDIDKAADATASFDLTDLDVTDASKIKLFVFEDITTLEPSLDSAVVIDLQ